MMSPLLKTPPALPAASRGALAFLLKSLIMLSVCGALQAQAPLRYNISEQVPSGTFVGNIRFDSRLASRYETAVFEQLRYSFLDPSEENVHRFSIDAITGILRTEGVLDREDFCAQRLSCVVNLDIAVGPRQYFQVIGVTVTVLDVNDRRPEFPQESITLEIAESASAGAIYKLPEAEDLDSGRFGIQGYRMETDFDDTFQLNVIEVGGRPSKIQLKLLKSLDREERDFYRVNIIAFDGGEPPELGVLEVNIAVGDANDHGPRFLNSTYRVVIPESARPQASVVRVSAEDEDIGKNGEIRYSFSDNDHDDVFAIDAESGEITLKGTLDYEKQQRYVLTVEAADGGVNSQPAYATVTVDVMDMNDNPPQISVNTLSAGASETAVVSELAQVGDMVAYISVKDPDSGLAGQFLCRLNEPHFRLEQTQPTKFKVVTAGPLDRERQDEYALVIECQDQGNPALVTTETIVVKVLDENDNAPIFPISTYYVELKENNHVKAWILQVNATEKDSGRNGEVRYALGQDAHDQFTIDPLSGVVRANAVFDYEQTDQVIFSVIAYDLGDPAQSTTATVVLSILDTNDEPPRFTEDSYRFNVRENQPVGIEIGMVSASDADSDHNNRIEYAMLPSKSAELFTVDTQTGQVRSKAQLDREEPGQALYHVTVIANNVGVTPPLSGSATVTIEVLDENDNAPIIDYPNSLNNTLYISSQVPLGYGIGPLQAHDLDVGDNAKLTFHVSGGNENGAFVIDPDTGMIETNIKLHDYDQKTFSVEVSVMDHGFPQHISKQMLHIVVNKSIAFAYEEQKSMLSTTNITIVVSLSVASVVVIIILVIAIVAVRRKGRRKQQQHVYRCRVEAQKRVADMKKDSAAGGGSRRSSVASSGSSGKQQNKKEVSFRLQKEGPGAPTSAEKKSLWPGAAGVNRSKCDIGKPNVSQGALHTQVARGPHFPTPLSVSELGSHHPPHNKQWHNRHPQGGQNDSREEQDSESNYSGEVSNTDSGRGPSEEGGDHHNNGAQPFHTQESARVPGFTVMPAKPIPGPHWLHPSAPHSHIGKPPPPLPKDSHRYSPSTFKGPYGAGPSTSTGILPGNRHTVANGNPPRPPKTLASPPTYGQCVQPSQTHSQNPYENHRFNTKDAAVPHPADNRGSGRTLQSWNSQNAEDDGASTTSGSYVVDSSDLFLEDYPPVRGVVV